ncbi:MAG: hypothetical protein HQL23_02730 [Candidatus Omnitrophica bacterium]|nr:hypothetical protein [Candidatus Omnitrophota bacterium]
MTKEKKSEPNLVSDIVKSISWGTGLLCGKVTNLGQIVKTKELSKMVKKTGAAVKAGIADMKESFEEGVKSLSEDGSESFGNDLPAAEAPAQTEPVEAKPKKEIKRRRRTAAAKAEDQDKPVVKRKRASRKKSAEEKKT